jgi:putative ABC transport system permease protein
VPVHVQHYSDWVKENRVFSSMGAAEGFNPNFTGTGAPESLSGIRMSPSFFKVLGVQPVIGRAFLSNEDQDGHDHVVILSYGWWRQEFGADRSILGRVIRLDGENYTVVGIMPWSFRFPEILSELRPMIYVPLS